MIIVKKFQAQLPQANHLLSEWLGLDQSGLDFIVARHSSHQSHEGSP